VLPERLRTVSTTTSEDWKFNNLYILFISLWNTGQLHCVGNYPRCHIHLHHYFNQICPLYEPLILSKILTNIFSQKSRFTCSGYFPIKIIYKAKKRKRKYLFLKPHIWLNREILLRNRLVWLRKIINDSFITSRLPYKCSLLNWWNSMLLINKVPY